MLPKRAVADSERIPKPRTKHESSQNSQTYINYTQAHFFPWPVQVADRALHVINCNTGAHLLVLQLDKAESASQAELLFVWEAASIAIAAVAKKLRKRRKLDIPW